MTKEKFTWELIGVIGSLVRTPYSHVVSGLITLVLGGVFGIALSISDIGIKSTLIIVSISTASVAMLMVSLVASIEKHAKEVISHLEPVVNIDDYEKVFVRFNPLLKQAKEIYVMTYITVTSDTIKYPQSRRQSKSRKRIFDRLEAAIKNPNIDYNHVFVIPMGETQESVIQEINKDEQYMRVWKAFRDNGHNDRAVLKFSNAQTQFSAVIVDQKHLYLNLDIYRPEVDEWSAEDALYSSDRRIIDKIFRKVTSVTRHANPVNPRDYD